MVNILNQSSVPPLTEPREELGPRELVSTVDLPRAWEIKAAALAVLFQAGLQIVLGLGFHLAFRWVLAAAADERLPEAISVAGYVSASLSLLLTYLSVGRFQSLYLLGFCALVGSYFPLGSEDWAWRVLGAGIAVVSILLLVPLTQPPPSTVGPRRARKAPAGVRSSPDCPGLRN